MKYEGIYECSSRIRTFIFSHIYCFCYEQLKKTCKILCRKSEMKREVEKAVRTLEDNIKNDLEVIACEDME